MTFATTRLDSAFEKNVLNEALKEKPIQSSERASLSMKRVNEASRCSSDVVGGCRRTPEPALPHTDSFVHLLPTRPRPRCCLPVLSFEVWTLHRKQGAAIDFLPALGQECMTLPYSLCLWVGAGQDFGWMYDQIKDL